MIQQIGIDITATGAQNVANEFTRIATSMQKFQQEIKGFNTAISGLSRRITTLDATSSKLKGVGSNIAAFSNQAGAALRGLSAQVGTLNTQLNSMAGGGGGRGGAGGGGSAAGGFLGSMFGGMMGPFGFMARFMAFHQALRAMQYGIKDIALGGSRQEIAKANLDLAAVSANANQRAMIEAAGHKFASRYGVVDTPEYIKTAAQTASALDINKLGAGTISKITEQNIVGSKMTSMGEAAFAEAQSKIMSSYLTRFDASVGQTLKAGGTATLPEFGKVNLQQLHAKIVAMTAKVVEKTNIWGQGLMDFYSYAGSLAGEKGIPLSQIFAMGGVGSDLGYKGAKFGRAWKSIMAGQSDKLATILMAGSTDYDPTASKKDKKQYDSILREKTAMINQMSETPEGQQQLMKMMAPALSRVMQLSKDPNFAYSLTKDFGVSTDFLPQILSMFKEATSEAVKELQGQVKDAKFEDTLSKFEDATKDAGWQIKKLSATWSGFATSLSSAVSNIIGSVADETGITGLLERGKSFLDKYNFRKNLEAAVNVVDKRPTGATGDYTNKTGEDIANAPGIENMKEFFNKKMADEFKDSLGSIEKPAADASEEKKLEYQNKVQELRAAIRNKYLKAWEEHWRPKEQVFIDDEGKTQEGYSKEYRFQTEAGFPHDTMLRDNEFYSRYKTMPDTDSPGVFQGRRLIDPFGFNKWKSDGSLDSSGTQGFMGSPMGGSPMGQGADGQPLFADPQNQLQSNNIEVKPNIKVVVELDGRELRSTMRAMLSEDNFYNRMNVGGEGLFTS